MLSNKKKSNSISFYRMKRIFELVLKSAIVFGSNFKFILLFATDIVKVEANSYSIF